MNVFSRLEATRKVLGPTKEPMSLLKIVQASSHARPFALLSANATDF